MEKQSLGISLFIDKEDFMMIMAMSIMYQGLLEDPTIEIKEREMIQDQLEAFMVKIDRLAHKNGWCSDPDCMWDGEGEKPDLDEDNEEDED